MEKVKAVIIVSGGMDSATLLYKIVKEGFDVYPVTFNYGQRHVREIQSAQWLCTRLHLEDKHKIITLPIKDIVSNSSLTSDIEVPEGHYADENMKLTVVPNRNMIMLSVALGHAINIKASRLFYGAHAGDHAIYPDCRPEFVQAMSVAALLADWHKVNIEAPFLHMDKGDIAKLGLELGVDWSLTWTCYKGKEKACLKCGACCERVGAFQKAGMRDPLVDRETWDQLPIIK